MAGQHSPQRLTLRLTLRLTNRTLRWSADERGAAAVEFAIVVPVLLVLVMGTIDFARMMAVAASLAAAVRDGARQGATISDFTDGTQVNAVRNRVVAAFQPIGGTALTTANVTVNAPNSSNNVVVSVSGYTYRPITPIASMIGMGTITFSRSATFRWERAPSP